MGRLWWLPPTDEGLADTTWVCDRWFMELRRGNGDPEYFGVAELSYIQESRNGISLPSFDDGMISMAITLSYG